MSYLPRKWKRYGQSICELRPKRTVYSRVTIYRDAKGEWRWRGKRAGRIVADCGEGYKNRKACYRSWQAFVRSIQQFNYTVGEDES